jgi:hypothetical protein
MADGLDPSSRSTAHVSGALISHLLVVARGVELSNHNAAESCQRSMTLFVRQQAPELVALQRPDLAPARGGAMTAALLDIGHLLVSLGSGIESNPRVEAGRQARLWGDLSISVKPKESV